MVSACRANLLLPSGRGWFLAIRIARTAALSANSGQNSASPKPACDAWSADLSNSSREGDPSRRGSDPGLLRIGGKPSRGPWLPNVRR